MAITASKIGLASKCLGAFALPGIIEIHGGQEEGNDRHEEHEDEIESGGVPEVLRDRWPGYMWRAEVSFAIDVATGIGRVLGIGIHRAYESRERMSALGIDPIGPFEISGTADAIGRGPAGELVVADWKSFDPRVERAAKNAQLHTLALAATRAFGIDECEVAISHLLRPFDVATLYMTDLDLFEGELKRIFEATAKAKSIVRSGGTVELTPGAHCRYCPAFMGPTGIACPAQSSMALNVTSADTVMAIEDQIPFEDDQAAADAFDLWERIKMLSTRLGSALRARAAERGFTLNDGRVFSQQTEEGNTKLNGNTVWNVLREKYTIELADRAVERKATQKKLKEALKLTGAKSVAAAKREVLAEVAKRGGLKREFKTKIEAREVKALKTG